MDYRYDVLLEYDVGVELYQSNIILENKIVSVLQSFDWWGYC